MGTITTKLNWLWTKKTELVDKIKTKFIRANNSWSGLDGNPSLEGIDSALNALTRRRLVPVITMYMPYSYGALNGVPKYVPLKWYSSSYSWLNNIIDKNRCMYDTEYIWDTTGQAPVLNREAQGVIVGTMPTHKYNAVYNQPFVLGMGADDNVGNRAAWNITPIYASLSYAYSSGMIKILLADDSTKNDGTFILGNIALVNPLIHPEVRDDFMVQLVNTHINPPARSNKVYGDSGNYSVVNTGTNITTVTINHGYNNYNYIWPVVTGELYPTGTQSPIVVSIKSIQINASNTIVTVATGAGGNIHRGGFKLMVYGKK